MVKGGKEKGRSPRRTDRQTWEDRATQLIDTGSRVLQYHLSQTAWVHLVHALVSCLSAKEENNRFTILFSASTQTFHKGEIQTLLIFSLGDGADISVGMICRCER